MVVQRLLATNALLRHNALLLGSTVFTGLFSYLFHPVVGKLLGNARYSDVLSLISLFGVILMPVQILTTVLNKFTAELSAQGRIDQVNYLIRLSTRWMFLIGAGITVVLIVVSPALASFLKLPSTTPVIIMSTSVAVGIAGTITNGAIQGRQKFGWTAIISFFSIVSRVALTAAFIVVGLGFNGAILGVVAASVLGYGISIIPLRDVLRGPKTPVPSLKPVFTYSLGTLLAALGSGLLSNTDILLAKHYLMSADASYYIAIVTVGRIVTFVTASCAGVMFPKVATLQQQGGNYRAILAWTLAATLILAIGVLTIFALFPSWIIGLILRTPPSPQVAGQLVWYGLAMLLGSLAGVLTTYFMSLGRMSFVMLTLACWALQASLIVRWHANVAQIVLAMVVVMAANLLGAAAIYIWQEFRTGRSTAVMAPMADGILNA